MKKICYVFPGQGGQFVGMGKDLYDADSEARAVFDEVDEFLGEKLSGLMFNGPIEELNLSHNVQPAIFAASIAELAAFKAAGAAPAPRGADGRTLENAAVSAVSGWVAPDFVLGHSLGEYAALYAAGCSTIGGTARLLRRRGELMQSAADAARSGAMAAIIGDPSSAGSDAIIAACAEAAAETKAVCEPANDNGAGQWVISGDRAAVEKAMEIAKSRGAKIAKMLAVSVPAHSRLMQPIALEFKAAIEEIKWILPGPSPVSARFVSNKTAGVMTDAAEIKESLAYQLTHGVRWRESVLNLRNQGVEEIVEIGPGNVLTGLCKRIAQELNCYKAVMRDT